MWVLLLGAIVTAIVASGAIYTFTGADVDGDNRSAAFDPRPTPDAPLTTAPLERIIVPAAGVDAPIVIKGVENDGKMQSPDNAQDVAWYRFTSRPGDGSNAVFAGHVDYADIGPAVFWRLNELKPGDAIQIRYADGVSVRYTVTTLDTVHAATASVEEIVGPTATDTLTLITCAGNFNRLTGDYDDRLVVRAEKVEVDPAS